MINFETYTSENRKLRLSTEWPALSMFIQRCEPPQFDVDTSPHEHALGWSMALAAEKCMNLSKEWLTATKESRDIVLARQIQKAFYEPEGVHAQVLEFAQPTIAARYLTSGSVKKLFLVEQYCYLNL